MKARPILFSASMINALLDGRKTQTRRVVKAAPSAFPSWWEKFHWATLRHFKKGALTHCPYGEKGDLLWVRETFCPIDDTEFGESRWVDYRATPKYSAKHPAGWDNEPDSPDALKWKPSIFMPKWASRITLEIKDVRVERLQDISDKDVKSEGVEFGNWCMARFEFEQLWQSINGKESWDNNPWVWVIEFKVHQKNFQEMLKVA